MHVIGISIGLSLGNSMHGRRKRRPNSDALLSSAMAAKVNVTAVYDGEELTFAPLVTYEDEGVLCVDVVLDGDFPAHGSRPPAITTLELALISSVTLTQTVFTVSPALARILARYTNVRAIVTV